MKRCLLLALSILTTTAGASRADHLPPGTYTFTAYPSSGGFCGPGTFGYLVYPGPGQNRFEIDYTGDGATEINHFPTIPGAGLEAWASPVWASLYGTNPGHETKYWRGQLSLTFQRTTHWLWSMKITFIGPFNGYCSGGVTSTLSLMRTGDATTSTSESQQVTPQQ